MNVSEFRLHLRSDLTVKPILHNNNIRIYLCLNLGFSIFAEGSEFFIIIYNLGKEEHGVDAQ